MADSSLRLQDADPIPLQLRSLLERAVDEDATDVHIDPFQGDAGVRFRVDGTIHPKPELAGQDTDRLINQIRVCADCGLDAPLKPDEGKFQYTDGRNVRDVRVTVIPTPDRKQAIHMRLLRPDDGLLNIANLGFNDEQMATIREAMSRSHGLMMVTGATGTGKTTTLHALALTQDLDHKIAAAIEDPVEYQLPQIRHFQVNRRHGMSMNDCLRTILRTDPDIVIVGEIRDQESALTTAQAALAGRMALATIHARDAAAAVEALYFLDVPHYVIGASLRLVIAQNLVRKVCAMCAHRRKSTAAEKKLYRDHGLKAPAELWDPVGCAQCHNYGYRGRLGVFEVASLDEELGHWVAAGQSHVDIRERFIERGARGILYDALTKAAQGLTTLQEATRFLAHGSTYRASPTVQRAA